MEKEKKVFFAFYEPEDDEEEAFFKRIPKNLLGKIKPHFVVIGSKVKCGFFVNSKIEIWVNGTNALLVFVEKPLPTSLIKGLSPKEKKIYNDLLSHIDYIRGDLIDFNCKHYDCCCAQVNFKPFLCIDCPHYKETSTTP